MVYSEVKRIKVINKFSIYFSITCLGAIAAAFFLGYVSQTLVFIYFCMSLVTFIVYAVDKSKAKRGKWRVQESTLHLLSLLGGWPGAGLAQQFLRHKSSKKPFRIMYWVTVAINLGLLIFLYSSIGQNLFGLSL